MKEFLEEQPQLAIACIIGLGIVAQVIASRIRMPSILLLLGFGVAISPAGFNLLSPDELTKDSATLFALVSAAVAVILFEGGLTLRLHEAQEIARQIWLLIIIGALVTWTLTALAAYWILGLQMQLAILLGALMVVTGPTVVGPLLRHVRPSGRVAAVVKWEGILSDPVGAILAVLVFETILTGEASRSTAAHVVLGVIKTLVIGTGMSASVAFLLIKAMKRGWIADYLQGVVSLAVVLAAFVTSNLLQHESGLLTVTLLGIFMANQRSVPVRHIIQFKEHLGVLLISVLFIVLGARMTREDIASIDGRALAFLAALILLVRPIAVLACKRGAGFSWAEFVFISLMAPRGIVAASVASVFAFQLIDAGVPGAERLVPVVFTVVVGTVAVYGLLAAPIAQRLGISKKNPQGVLFLGAHEWARAFAEQLQKAGLPVLLVDTNRDLVNQARMQGLRAYHGNLISERTMDQLDLGGIGRMIALTPNEEANALAALHAIELFGRMEVYQLASHATGSVDLHDATPLHLKGRTMVGPGFDFPAIERRFRKGAVLKSTRISNEFNFAAFKLRYQDTATPIFTLSPSGNLTVAASDRPLAPRADDLLIFILDQSQPT